MFYWFIAAHVDFPFFDGKNLTDDLSLLFIYNIQGMCEEYLGCSCLINI